MSSPPRRYGARLISRSRLLAALGLLRFQCCGWVGDQPLQAVPWQIAGAPARLQAPRGFHAHLSSASAPTQMTAMRSGSEIQPVQDSPLVEKLFENERIRISNFLLPPGAETPEALHEFPTIRWQVDAGKHTLLADDSPPSVEDVPDKKVFFLPAGSRWRVKNEGDAVYRQILWEIKQPAKYSPEEAEARLKRAVYSTHVGTELMFENDLCRVWDFYLEPGEGGGPESVHQHVFDYAFVYVAKGRLLGFHHDMRPGLFDSINENNDVTWFYMPENAPEEPDCAHGGKNGYDDSPMREYLVELK